MSSLQTPHEAIAWLRSPGAIRARCRKILSLAERDALNHFRLDASQIAPAARYVLETIEFAYPNRVIPYHSRWRHFAADGIDRWGQLAPTLNLESEEIARVRVDLAVTSVLLDAGAGEQWTYREPGTDNRYGRSEGLAVASFHMFTRGVFSALPTHPLRCDADALVELDRATLLDAFQVTESNPIVGLDGRIELLRKLGQALYEEPELFGARAPRAGNLFDWLAGQARGGRLPAVEVLNAVLRGFGSIWPGRIALGGTNLGDVWHHSGIRTDDLTDRLIPFHKLSQWLSYSLVEPLEEAGIRVTDLDALTGLPEYRNGGLLVDLGVLVPRHDAVLVDRHLIDSEVIVEWRALTVALLDDLADALRVRLRTDSKTLPLAKVLQGGTWSAGRRIARERRADGSPPIRLDSDGTVF